MRAVIDGHGNWLEVRLGERVDKQCWDEFVRTINLISEVANRGARVLRFSIRPPHFLNIPPRGAGWKLNNELEHLPCLWEVELGRAAGALAALLTCADDLSALFVLANYITPQIQLVTSEFAKITLYPLRITFLLPYPIPDIEFTDDMEQITEVGTAMLEATGEVSLDAIGASYRNYLRYYIRNITPGMRLFLCRIVLFHALTARDLRIPRRLTLVTVEDNPIFRRLQIIAEEDIPCEEKVLAARLLLKFEESEVTYEFARRVLADIVPQWEMLLWVERATLKMLGGSH